MGNAWHTLIFLVGAITTTISAADVFKCTDAQGRTQYSDAPCGSTAKVLRQSTLRGNVIDGSEERSTAARVRREIYQQNNQLSYSSGNSRSGCPSEREIKNLETSASSVTATRDQQRMHADALRLARACGTGQTVEPTPSRRPYENVTGHAGQNTGMSSCDSTGCWDVQGRRYNSAAGGNLWREDGKFCVKVGPDYQCR